MAGKQLAGDYAGPAHAALVEIREDWAAYKTLSGYLDGQTPRNCAATV